MSLKLIIVKKLGWCYNNKRKREASNLKISTKGRYALRVMIDLAINSNEKYISLKDIAMRQEISNKYLEQIIIFLIIL